MYINYHLHIQNTSLFSCDWCWLQWVARGNGNQASLPESGQIGQQGPIWKLHSAKFAKVCIRTWVEVIFAGKLFGRTKSCHQKFIHCWKHDAQSAISKQTNNLNASERLLKCESVNSSDVSQQTFSWQCFFNQVYTKLEENRPYKLPQHYWQGDPNRHISPKEMSSSFQCFLVIQCLTGEILELHPQFSAASLHLVLFVHLLLLESSNKQTRNAVRFWYFKNLPAWELIFI